jgi:predicted Zn finger-like uncharacterized protein
MRAISFISFDLLLNPYRELMMLVKCPSCTTTFTVADELLTGATPAFRCSRCKHTFELDLQAPADPASVPREVTSTVEADDRRGEFAFVFGAQEEEEQSANHEQEERRSGSQADFARPIDSLIEQETQRWSLPSGAKGEEPFTISADRISHGIEAKPDGHANGKRAENTFEEISPPAQTNNISVLEPYRDQRASTLPYLSLFALLILFFSLATAFQYAYPDVFDTWIKKVPLIGAAIAKNHRLKDGVALQSVRGSYQVIQGNREIFVVTGIAMNQNPVVIREVRIGGETYSSEEKSVEQQHMWIGNAISPKIIRGMTAQDIADLQRLKPLKTFEIPPGDSAPFTIVFLKPAKAVKNFSCTVLAAEEEV